MKQIIITLFFAAFAQNLSAQSLTIEKSASAAEALEQISKIKTASEVAGYRIGIFFDNSQDARYKASEAKKLFEQKFPSQPVYMVYQSPYYKVSAGDCLTEEEAIILFEQVRSVFPNAFVMRENMNISAFVGTEQEFSAMISNPADTTQIAPAL